MRVIITGGSGMIGSALTANLLRDGHEVIILSRNPERAAAKGLPEGTRAEGWDACTAKGWGHLADGADAIVNLAGASIEGDIPFLRWTAARKRSILESRKNAGRAVVEAVQAARQKPRAVIQASAVGYYGSRGDEVITEETPPGDDFLARVCLEWEAATRPVEDMGVRRVVTRSAPVFSPKRGLYPFIRLQFKMFAGGPLGSGRQWLSWIHLADEVAAHRFLIDSGLNGTFNLMSPNPVPYRQFARALGEVMHRPAFVPAPAFALRLAMGEKADQLLLTSQRAIPERLQRAGFAFQFPELEPALRDLEARPS